jgi:pimeloyl-ACP methyl ester carboxylesterase
MVVVERLTTRHRVIAIDRRGHGHGHPRFTRPHEVMRAVDDAPLPEPGVQLIL